MVFENATLLLVKKNWQDEKLNLQACKPKFASAWKLDKHLAEHKK